MAATPWVSDRDWELVFEDNFDGSALNTHNWSRIDYVNYNGANTNPGTKALWNSGNRTETLP